MGPVFRPPALTWFKYDFDTVRFFFLLPAVALQLSFPDTLQHKHKDTESLTGWLWIAEEKKLKVKRSVKRSWQIFWSSTSLLSSPRKHECRCRECLAKDEVSPAPPRMPKNDYEELRSPLSPQWNHVRIKKIQKWNTLNSQHGGLGRCSCIFFCPVSRVGPLGSCCGLWRVMCTALRVHASCHKR